MRVGDREWQERVDRERQAFDRAWRWVFPLVVVFGVVGAIASLALYAGAAAFLWHLID